ncbi:conserved hypothetical protein, membrane [Candidatus Magnetomorum sp. HK-1]|nr:conserved hypothetical protein, membrane [Candidatus Magnetomorum sp. HK-1]
MNKGTTLQKVFISIIAVLGMSMNFSIANAIESVVIDSYTHSDPSNLTTITVSWSHSDPDGITGYYNKLTTESAYTITDIDDHISNKNQDEKTFTNLSDDSYYFHIAAYKIDDIFPEVGDTTSVGPLTVDTQAPVVSVNGPQTTSENPITLDIGPPDEIDAVCISEGVYGSCVWKEDYGGNYELLSGEGQYVLKIQGRDHAGNVANADPYAVTFITSENLVMSQYTSVPTLSQWGMIFFITILICVGISASRRNLLGVNNKKSSA